MTDLREYGYPEEAAVLPDGLVPARVTEVHRELYKVICEHGEATAGMKGSFFHKAAEKSDFPAVGDFVLIKHNQSGNSSIVKVLPRKSKFSRTDFSGHAAGYAKTLLEQVVAANFDYVFIMSSLNQDFNVNRIVRYLTQARQSGGMPVVVLTKADLCENWEEQVKGIREVANDVDIIPLSSHTGLGLDKLAGYLKPGKTIVFLGMSGVGKSSLLNTLARQRMMFVKEIREDDARGRHTTTHRQLIKLPSGAMIIDTPGMRELGLWDAEEGIRSAFADVEELFAKCRFSNCGHKSEPGCAVLAALADGSLPGKQWEGYLAQKREAAFVERKSKIAKKQKVRMKDDSDC